MVRINDSLHSLKRKIQAAYRQTSRRLILLDYDGTLVPFKPLPEGSRISKSMHVRFRQLVQKLNLSNLIREKLLARQLNSLLKILSADSKNNVVIISGRNREFLADKFHGIPLYLAGEHGAWLKEPGAAWKIMLEYDPAWKEQIKPIFELCVKNFPGAFIEEKDFSLAWHYRMVKEPLAGACARELKSVLLKTLAGMNADLKILDGSKTLEVKQAGIHKGKIVEQFLAQAGYDFILCLGDDMTDEDMFKVLPPGSFSIKVGEQPTSACYRIAGYAGVRELLAVCPENS